MKVKTLLPLGIVSFIVLYMAYAFVNWDIVWVTSVDAVMRVTYLLVSVAIWCIAICAYLESKEKH